MQEIIAILMINIVIAHGFTCDEILELPPNKNLSQQELETMIPKDIVQCVAHLGRNPLPPPSADFIWKAIIEFHEGIVHIPDEILSILHWITPAVTPQDYSNMTLNNIDVIQNFGLNYNLNDDQLSALATRVREDFAQKEPDDYTCYDLTAIRQILCAFNKTEIERIPPSSYKDAAPLIGTLEKCSADAMSGFAALAVKKEAFGPITGWTADIVNNVGKVANYLPKKSIINFNIHPNLA